MSKKKSPYNKLSVLKNQEGSPTLHCNQVDDVTPKKKNEEELKQYQDHLEELVEERTLQIEIQQFRLKQYFNAVSRLAKEDCFVKGNTDAAFQTVLKELCYCLRVERAGVWLYNEKKNAIVCKKMLQNGEQEKPTNCELQQKEFPAYFSALEENQIIDINDSGNIKIVEEFSENYLKPNNISSMLDLPFKSEGNVIGVICLENTGKERTWEMDEINFAVSLSEFITRAIESAKRNTAIQAKKESETRFRSIFDNTSIGVAIVGPDGNFIMINQAFCNMLDYSDDELIKKTFKDITHPDDLKNSFDNYQRILNREITSFNIQKRYLTQYGRTIHANTTSSAVLNDKGELIYTVAMIEDITERVAEREEMDAFFDVNLDLFCVASLEGYFLKLNPSWEKTLGWSVDELKLKPFLEFVHPDDVQTTMDEVASLEEGSSAINFVNRYLCKDGTYRWLSWNSVPLNGKLYASAKDITNIKLQEKEIIRSSNLNAAMLRLYACTDKEEREFMQFGLDEIVTLSDSTIGYMHFFDPTLKEISLIAWSTHTHKMCTATYDNHYPLAKAGIWADSVRLKKPVIVNDYKNYAHKKRLPKGHFPLHNHLGIPIFDKDEVVGIIGIGNKKHGYTKNDINQLEVFTKSFWHLIKSKRNDEALKKSEKKFRFLFENMNEGFAVHKMIYDQKHKPIDYQYLDLNPTFTKFTGLTKELALSNTVRNIIPGIENDKADWIQTFGKVALTGEETAFENYSEALNKWFRVHAFSAGKDEFAVTFSDISERVDQEKKLELMMAELERSNQELEQFAYISSHDLQEPLRKVKNYSDLLLKKYGESVDDGAKKYLGIINNGVERMQTLIEDLLSYSRVTTRAASFERVNLNAVVDDVLDILEYRIRNSNAIVEVGKLPEIKGDFAQLRQLFQNLISNGIKFRKEENPILHIGATKKGDLWEVFVKDNGIGIDPQYNKRVFEVFQRLHARNQYQGTGIGLAICKKIVERHKGTIGVNSELGKGAKFYFTLQRI